MGGDLRAGETELEEVVACLFEDVVADLAFGLSFAWQLLHLRRCQNAALHDRIGLASPHKQEAAVLRDLIEGLVAEWLVEDPLPRPEVPDRAMARARHGSAFEDAL